MSVSAELNRSNLKAARKARKLSLEEVADFTKIKKERIEAFESGDAEPTIRQLDRLAQLYNVPLHSFFDRDALVVESTLPDFRKAGAPTADLTPKGLTRLWQAERVSEFTNQLVPMLDVPFGSTRRLTRHTNQPLPSANQLRQLFDEWRHSTENKLKYQGPESQKLFRLLRHYMESLGCLTLVNDAPPEDYLGFYKSFARHGRATFVNKNIDNQKRQLFTLAHEFAHFLQNVEGVSDPFISVNAVEKESNRFAAEFLAPDDHIFGILDIASQRTRADPQQLVRWVSEHSMLSLQACALRLRDLDVIRASDTKLFFSTFKSREEASDRRKPVENKPMGRSVVVGRKVSELGHLVVYVAAQAVKHRLIDTVDVSRTLNISEGLQRDVFDLASRRFEATLG